MNRSIVTALTGQPEPPCTIYKCESERECATCSKACMAFLRYVSSASGRFPAAMQYREPSDFYYHKIFVEE